MSVPVFRSAKAVGADGTRYLVVVDDAYELHVEASAYLAGLRAADLAFNTEATYAPRLALYLTWCAATGVDWTRPTVAQMKALMNWLQTTPIGPREGQSPSVVRYRQPSTADAIVGTATGFLAWSSLQGWVPVSVVNTHVQLKHLHFLPKDFDAGEDGQHRVVSRRTVRLRCSVPGYEWLSGEQLETLAGLVANARDRFLLHLMSVTGMRIGETLGLRREDVHLLPDSRSLGCMHAGPHVHVRRRENANGAWAKSRVSRVVPVVDDTAGLFDDYQNERDAVPQAAGVDMVFVNLFRAPLGEPMKYHGAYGLFCRLAGKAGFRARPHMIRHSAATAMLRAGTQPDVVSDVLGHASAASLGPYSHVTDTDMRQAVQKAAEGRRPRRGGAS